MSDLQNGETAPLLGEIPNLARNINANVDEAVNRRRRAVTVRAVTYSVLSLVFVLALVGVFAFWDKVTGVVGRLPKDPHDAALLIMERAPVIVSNEPFASDHACCMLKDVSRTGI